MNAAKETPLEKTPFDFKRLGEFDQALREYARYHDQAVELGDRFMEEQCFEQMFDLALLDFYRQQEQSKAERESLVHVKRYGKAAKDDNLFRTKQELRQAIATQLWQLLKQNYRFQQETFDNALERCWRKFSPRGRGRNPFSVDSEWLVAGSSKAKKADLS